MGNALSVAGWVTVATILLIVMAILILVATNRARDWRNNNPNLNNSNINNVYNKLVWAQVFAWIAAGIALLLALGYVFLHFVNTTEWVHLILWILLFAAIITSGILLIIALSDLDKMTINNDDGIKSYIWGALITGLIVMIVLLISGGWRIAANQGMVDQYYIPTEMEGPIGPMGPMDMAEMPPALVPGAATGQVQVTTGEI